MESLPEELLDYILGLLSPYQDLSTSKLVCKKWYSAVLRVVRRKQCNLITAIKNNNLKWELGQWNSCMPLRHSHATCCYDGDMYTYGGFSNSQTTFNDLAALDLTTRTWRRMESAGHFPSPKAGATLCAYNGKLILHGGCAYPSNLTPFQPLIIYDELHVFDIKSSTWSDASGGAGSHPGKPATTSHTATVHGNLMVTFGGLLSHQGRHLNVSNNVYCLNLDTMAWSSPRCSPQKPPPMFEHSQIYLDNHRLLVLGGRDITGGARQNAWLLTMGEEPWQWTQIADENPQWLPPRLTNHPIISVGDCVVAFSRCQEDKTIPPMEEPPDRDVNNAVRPEENLNGRRGAFRQNREELGDNRLININRGNCRARRQQQLALLEKYEKKYCKEKQPIVTSPSMNLYVGDIENVVTEGKITWQEPRYSVGCPSDRMSFSLLLGNSEIILSGGFTLEFDESTDVQWPETHHLVFAKAPRLQL